MQLSHDPCRCCGKSAPEVSFARMYVNCITCATSEREEAIINLTWTNYERIQAIKTATKAGRRAARIENRIKQHLAEGGKRCGSCWHRKPIEGYGLCKTYGDGLQQTCKVCTSTQSMIRRTAPVGDANRQWRVYRNAMRSSVTAVPPNPADRRQKGAAPNAFAVPIED